MGLILVIVTLLPYLFLFWKKKKTNLGMWWGIFLPFLFFLPFFLLGYTKWHNEPVHLIQIVLLANLLLWSTYFFLPHQTSSFSKRYVYLIALLLYQYLALIQSFTYPNKSTFFHMGLSTFLIFFCYGGALFLFSDLEKKKESFPSGPLSLKGILMPILLTSPFAYLVSPVILLLIPIQLFLIFLWKKKEDWALTFLLGLSLTNITFLGVLDSIQKGWVLYLFSSPMILRMTKLSLFFVLLFFLLLMKPKKGSFLITIFFLLLFFLLFSFLIFLAFFFKMW